MSAKTPVVAVLSYHKIGEPPPDGWRSWYYVSEDRFTGHLEYLRDHGWPVLDAATFIRGLGEPGSLPDRSALLTFDDAYRSMRSVALPVLLRFDFPAVVFVPAGRIGWRNEWDQGIEPTEQLCDWDDLHALREGGVSIQSHGWDHRRFSELSADARGKELRRSRRFLQQRTGTDVALFAYPYGDDGEGSPEIRSQVEAAGYSAAFLFGGGPVAMPVSDPFGIERLAVGSDTELDALLGPVSAGVAR